MRRHLLALCLLAASLLLTGAARDLAAQVLAPAVPETVGVSSERLDRLTQTLQRYVDAERLPGGVVLVARDGRVVYHEAFGELDRELGAPMRSDALFRIASQTKALVSVGVMMLQEEGQLLISDPVGAYLPAFGETSVAVKTDDGYTVVPAERPITIRHLLTHTAGIGYGYGPAAEAWAEAGIQGWYFADRDEPIRATIDRMAALPMDAQPGTTWTYGYGTDILGALIEAVSGQSLDAFLRARLLDPLGMTDSHFYPPPEDAERMAAVYSVGEDGTLQRAPNPGGMVGQGAYVEGPRVSFSGGAGLVSTAQDYARFLQMLLDGGALGDARLLAPSTVALMTADHLGAIPFPWGAAPGADTFGLGFQVRQQAGTDGLPGSVGAFGWGGAYHSTYWVDPAERLVVVYLTQVIPATGLDDHDKLRALVYQALVD